MTTYGTMQTRIANEIARTDLTNEIKDAIQSAIAHHSNERFWFNDVRGKTFSTVAEQRAYGSTALADIPTMARIDDIVQVQGSTVRQLDPVSPLELELLQSPATANGKPASFTWIEDEIHLWPTPNAVYLTRLFGISRLSTLSADADTNAWMTYGERLIRAKAKMILFSDVIFDFGPRYQAAMADEDSALSKLLSETEARMPTGRIVGTEF